MQNEIFHWAILEGWWYTGQRIRQMLLVNKTKMSNEMFFFHRFVFIMDYFTISNNWLSWFTTFIQINIRERGDRSILHFWFQYYQKFVYSYIIQKKMLLIYTTHTQKKTSTRRYTLYYYYDILLLRYVMYVLKKKKNDE